MASNAPLLPVEKESPELERLRGQNKLLKASLSAFAVVGALYGTASLRPQGPASLRSQGGATVGRRAFLAGGLAVDLLASPRPTATAALESDRHEEDVTIPEFFDTRSQWLGCGTYVVDQGQCGDCWAASAANVLGDRACIHLQADWSPVPLPHHGAHGAGAMERMFQQAGSCIGNGTMGMAHEHGCRRGNFFISPQPLVSCGNLNNTSPPTYHPYPANSSYKAGHTLYPSSGGCNGGEAWDAWRYIYHEGLSQMDGAQTGGCTPYTSGLCSGQDPYNNGCHACNFEQCANTGVTPKVLTVDSFGWIMEEDLPARIAWGKPDESFNWTGTDMPRPKSQMAAMDRQVRKMQIEMMTNGPLHTCIDDFGNFGNFFNNYPQAIYNSTEGSPNVGGHCIELVGWGTDQASGMKYWTWKNSWGPNFANGGFGRIIRGVDLCGLESDVWTGCPSGSHCELTAGVVRNETWVPHHAWFPVPPNQQYTTGTTNLTEQHQRHPTSAKQPSRTWPGGREVELSREAFLHGTVAPTVVAAVRHALGSPDLDHSSALAKAQRVWTRSVRGLRVRVQVEGAGREATAHHHMEGHVTVE